LVTTGLLILAWQLRKESRDFLKALTAPKPPTQQLPPMYIPYEKVIPSLERLVTKTFQRGYINNILPNISNNEGKVRMLAPSDKVYSDFITSTTLQVYEAMPHYLMKSLYYYYDVKNATDGNDSGILALTQNITVQVTSLLNNQIIDIAQKIELNGPSANPVLDATSKMAQLFNGKNTNDELVAPDGTKGEVVL
jgi:hypothetical protein